jgi:hypothetical protein
VRQLHCAENSEGYGIPRPSSREPGRKTGPRKSSVRRRSGRSARSAADKHRHAVGLSLTSGFVGVRSGRGRASARSAEIHALRQVASLLMRGWTHLSSTSHAAEIACLDFASCETTRTDCPACRRQGFCWLPNRGWPDLRPHFFGSDRQNFGSANARSTRSARAASAAVVLSRRKYDRVADFIPSG